MAARVVHFGANDCHRVAVLKDAGYSVDQCPSIGLLATNLIQFPAPDAVAIEEREGKESEAVAAVSLTRSSCAAPLVLFQAQDRDVDSSFFDLVIAPCTRPATWLSELEILIARSRDLRSRAREIQTHSALISQEARELIDRSRRERARSASLLKRPLPDSDKK